MDTKNIGQAVIVGATGTVGSTLVAKFIKRGIPVLAIARNADKLDELAKGSELITAYAADLADNASIGNIESQLRTPVRIAIFAAGLPVRGSAETIDPELLAVGSNIKLGGVVRLLRAVKDNFQEQHARFVVFAGSLGVEPTAHEAGPGAGPGPGPGPGPALASASVAAPALALVPVLTPAPASAPQTRPTPGWMAEMVWPGLGSVGPV